VILREVVHNSTYELVGHAYVHGIMHGEALGYMDCAVGDTAERILRIKKFCLVRPCHEAESLF
jgi:hypothetical protein